MANTLPNVHSGWYFLSHLQNIDKKETFSLFRKFIALKIAIPFAFPDGINWPVGLPTLAVFLVIIAAASERFSQIGMLGILGFAFFEVYRTWPFTINHTGLEFGIILLMCLKPDCDDMIKILMLSVWFYSGIHKLVDGYYLNGEFFALEALLNETPFGYRLNQVLDLFDSSILLFLSWLSIIVEITLPLLMLTTKWRSFALIGLFIAQGFISYFSQEIDFAFTAFGILFLFTPRLAPLSYPSLALLFLVVRLWM